MKILVVFMMFALLNMMFYAVKTFYSAYTGVNDKNIMSNVLTKRSRVWLAVSGVACVVSFSHIFVALMIFMVVLFAYAVDTVKMMISFYNISVKK